MPHVVPFILAIALIVISYRFQTRHMLRHYKQYQTVSHMYRNAKFRDSFAVGLIVTGILQIAYAAALSFPPNYAYIDLSKLVFMFGGLGAIFLGIFSLADNFIIHEFASFQYFLGLAIGAILITLQAAMPLPIQLASLGIVGIWALSIFWEIRRHNGVFAIETIHVLLSYVWILLIAAVQLNY